MAFPNPIAKIYYRYYAWKTKQMYNKLMLLKYNSYRKSVGLEPIKEFDATDLTVGGIVTVITFPYLLFQLLWTSVRDSKATQWIGQNRFVKQSILFLLGIGCAWAYYGICRLTRTSDPILVAVCAIWMLIVMSFGMAYWDKMRIVALLSVPFLFSRQFRIIVYAIILIKVSYGPMANVQYNMQVAGEVWSCSIHEGQVELEEEALTSVQGVKEHLQAMYDETMAKLEKIAAIMEKFGKAIKMAVRAGMWVIKTLCNASLIPLVVLHFTGDGGCAAYFNKLADKVSDQMTKAVNAIANNLNEEYNPNIDIIETYQYKAHGVINYLKIVHKVGENIAQELEWTSYFSWLVHVPIFIIPFYILARAIWYNNRYHAREDYDNIYINEQLIEVDRKRHEAGRETALPLLVSERSSYIVPMSLRLTSDEITSLVSSLLISFMFISNAIVALAGDYYLWWALNQYRDIQKMVSFDINVRPPRFSYGTSSNSSFDQRLENMNDIQMDQPNTTSVNIWDKFKNLAKKCTAPEEFEPDYDSHKEIYFWIFVVIISCVLEAYMLRFRHIILNGLYPAQAMKRGQWLCNNIVQARGSFSRFMKYQIINRLGNRKIEQVPLIYRLSVSFPIIAFIRRVLGYKHKYCTNCGKQGNIEDFQMFRHCMSTKGCSGIYCLHCLQLIDNICPVCSLSVEVVLDSDVSEELDSSDQGSDYYDSEYCLDEDRINDQPLIYRMRRMMKRAKVEDDEEGRQYIPLQDLDTNRSHRFPIRGNYRANDDEELSELTDAEEPLLDRDLEISSGRSRVVIDKYSLRAMRQNAHMQVDNLRQTDINK